MSTATREGRVSTHQLLAGHPELQDLAVLSFPGSTVASESVRPPVLPAHEPGATALRAAGVRPVAELPGEAAARVRHSDFFGTLAAQRAVARTGEQKKDAPERVSLLTMRRQAREATDAEDRAEARAGIRANASTIVQETYAEVGDVIEVEVDIDEEGNLHQHGAAMTDVLANTYLHLDLSPHMLDRIKVDALNVFRFRENSRPGSCYMEISTIPVAARDELVDCGFFLTPMTCMIRFVEIAPNGRKGKITSFLMGGVDQTILPPRRRRETEDQEKARQERALDERFDLDVARDMLEAAGVDGASTLDPTGILDHPVEWPAHLPKTHALRFYDARASARLRKPVFMGIADKMGDYGAFLAACFARKPQLDPTIDEIVQAFLDHPDEPATEPEATQLLREIAKDRTVEHAVTKHDWVDLYRFGREAGDHLWDARDLQHEARMLAERGATARAAERAKAAKQSIVLGTKAATTPDCPPGSTPPPPKNASSGSGEGGSTSSTTKDKDKGEKAKDGEKPAKAEKKKGRRTEKMYCVHCPLCEEDGVDATIDYYPEKGKKIITCSDCNGHKEYPHSE